VQVGKEGTAGAQEAKLGRDGLLHLHHEVDSLAYVRRGLCERGAGGDVRRIAVAGAFPGSVLDQHFVTTGAERVRALWSQTDTILAVLTLADRPDFHGNIPECPMVVPTFTLGDRVGTVLGGMNVKRCRGARKST
jgi:hypothetical protein